ncbi:MAG: hypothetical protein U0794_11045 [Isosphaeraceae bacterium]
MSRGGGGGRGVAVALLLVALGAVGVLGFLQWRSNQSLSSMRQIEQQRIRLASGSIESLQNSVAEDLFLNEPRSQAVRDRLLALAVDYYYKLSALPVVSQDRAARLDRVATAENLARLMRAMGRPDEAAGAYRGVLAARESLAADKDATLADRVAVADAHLRISQVLAEAAKQEEAMASCRKAEALLLPLNQSDVSVRVARARCRTLRGFLLLSKAVYDEEEPELGRARAELEMLADTALRSMEDLRDLAKTSRRIGLLLQGLGKTYEAEAELLLAVHYGERLLQAGGGGLLQRELNESRADLARVFREQGRFEESLAVQRRVRDTFALLLQGAPGVASLRRGFAQSQGEIAALLVREGKSEEAWQALSRAVDTARELVREDPASVADPALFLSSLTQLAELASRTSKAVEASTLLDEAEGVLHARPALSKQNPGVVGECRRVQAELARRAGKIEVAVRLLIQAVEANESSKSEGPDLARQARLAIVRSSLGTAVADLGRADEAERRLRQAVEGASELIRSHPENRASEDALRFARMNLGRFLTNQERWADAKAVIEAANELARNHLVAGPNAVADELAVGTCLNLLARVETELGQFDRASARLVWSESIHRRLTAEFPAIDEHPLGLAEALAGLGRNALRAGLKAEAESWVGHRNDATRWAGTTRNPLTKTSACRRSWPGPCLARPTRLSRGSSRQLSRGFATEVVRRRIPTSKGFASGRSLCHGFRSFSVVLNGTAQGETDQREAEISSLGSRAAMRWMAASTSSIVFSRVDVPAVSPTV